MLPAAAVMESSCRRRCRLWCNGEGARPAGWIHARECGFKDQSQNYSLEETRLEVWMQMQLLTTRRLGFSVGLCSETTCMDTKQPVEPSSRVPLLRSQTVWGFPRPTLWYLINKGGFQFLWTGPVTVSVAGGRPGRHAALTSSIPMRRWSSAVGQNADRLESGPQTPAASAHCRSELLCLAGHKIQAAG